MPQTSKSGSSNRRAYALSGTSIRRKRHESVMRSVMSGKCCHRFALVPYSSDRLSSFMPACYIAQLVQKATC